MTIADLARQITTASLTARGHDSTCIEGVTNDSRTVSHGSLYAALPGDHVDGHQFIASAMSNGATAILCSQVPEQVPPGIAVFKALNTRLALSEIADVFNGRPSQQLDVIGVTGTDGKSSTVYFLHQLLKHLTERSSYLSTAAVEIGGDTKPNLLHQSTPESPAVHSALLEMVGAGSRFAILESTSHGLSAKTCRLAHVAYRCAVFTNLSHEHLEFHRTFEQYRADKGNLFRALDTGRMADAWAQSANPRERDEPLAGSAVITTWSAAVGAAEGRFGIVNLNSPEAGYFAASTRQPVVGVSVDGGAAAVSAVDLRPDAKGTTMTLVCDDRVRDIRLNVPGAFNVENALEALACAALLSDSHPIDLAEAFAGLKAVEGRMTIVQADPYIVAVDYAHTPGSFEKVLPFFRAHTAGRLIVVFGSAGERDVDKRSIQGAVADRFADIIILANEDPRGEDPMAVLNDIAGGCPARRAGDDLFKIPDRRSAISHAVGIARPGDTVLLLGKGHEASIITATGPEPWDEIAVAREELNRLL